jgi:ABC-2 type transport system ATP-binding protein
MKQRLGVAMALLPDPDLLVLDEPANGLDPLGIIGVRDLLRRLREQGKTIFLSSHLLGELEQVMDWLVMLHHGKALYDGPARAFLDQGSQLLVETTDTAQREVVAQIARTAGYAVTDNHTSLTINCPVDFATELQRQSSAAGVDHLNIRAKEASFEERFLALVKGAQS